MDINKLVLGLKREFWEYRRMIILVPLVLSGLVILASIAATLSSKNLSPETQVVEQVDQIESEKSPSLQPESEASNQIPPAIKAELKKRTAVDFVGVYIGVAWFASLIYLLSSLYADRKDKSVLYWKSLPVSETQNTLTKLVFGSIVFPLVALLIAWAVYILLAVLGFGAIKSADGYDSWQFVERTINASRLFIWPLVAIPLGALWGAPMFCYTIMISAMSKRLPFLFLVLPPIVIAIIEGILFSSSPLAHFFFGHFPFVVLYELGGATSISQVLNLFFVERGASLVTGLVLSAAFLFAAVWYRNNRFEIT